MARDQLHGASEFAAQDQGCTGTPSTVASAFEYCVLPVPSGPTSSSGGTESGASASSESATARSTRLVIAMNGGHVSRRSSSSSRICVVPNSSGLRDDSSVSQHSLLKRAASSFERWVVSPFSIARYRSCGRRQRD